ncbi:MAG: hypothetical protein K6E31_07025 [bacterium]|nr:hypothetical protein [bacterium]
MNTALVNELYVQLSDESKSDAIDYMEYLIERDRKRRAEKLVKACEEIDKILDGDTGWANEEEMVADMANFRKNKMKL